MKQENWEIIKQCAAMEPISSTPVALIVDSPWIPGYLDISAIDYFSMPDIWLRANLEVERQFPEVIFLPGFWVEMGMAAEPSGFGCRVPASLTIRRHSFIPSLMKSRTLASSNNPTRHGMDLCPGYLIYIATWNHTSRKQVM